MALVQRGSWLDRGYRDPNYIIPLDVYRSSHSALLFSIIGQRFPICKAQHNRLRSILFQDLGRWQVAAPINVAVKLV